MRNTRLSYYLSFFATVLAFLVVVVGAYTRLTDAGLGCPDWPGCYGHWIVPKANVLQNTVIDSGKAWTEMIHRYMAGFLSLSIFALLILAIRNRRLSTQQPIVLPIAIALLVIFQALLGMWTVTLKLFPLVVIAHLVGGLSTLSLLCWQTLKLKSNLEMTLQADYPKTQITADHSAIASSPALKKLRIWTFAGLIVLSIQLLLGGWTSASYSALACTDFPFCQPHLDFEMNITQALEFSTKGLNSIEAPEDYKARMTIHMLHRFGAILTALFIGGLAFLTFKTSKTFKASKSSLILALSIGIGTLLIVQIALGISNILALLPLSVAVAHNAVAALLLLTIVSLHYYVWNKQ